MKKRRIVIISISVLILLILGAGALYFVTVTANLSQECTPYGSIDRFSHEARNNSSLSHSFVATDFWEKGGSNWRAPKNIFTNSSDIIIYLPVVSDRNGKSKPIKKINVLANLGLVTSFHTEETQLGFMEGGGCGTSSQTALVIYYHLTEEMFDSNKTDEISVDFEIGGNAVTQKYIVNQAVWINPVLKNAVVEVLENGLLKKYKAPLNQEVVYSIELKKADGQPLTGQSISLVEAGESYIVPTIIKPFAEMSPGIYETTIISSTEGKANMRVNIENKIANPEYNNQELVFDASLNLE